MLDVLIFYQTKFDTMSSSIIVIIIIVTRIIEHGIPGILFIVIIFNLPVVNKVKQLNKIL